MKKNKPLTGFTIIELLVVIAVISVLAAIVLFYSSRFKLKAMDAVIKSDMTNFFKLAQDYYQAHNENYAAFCNEQSTEDLFNKIPAYNAKKDKYCMDNSTYWYVCAQLNYPEDRSRAWCMDWTGRIQEICADACKKGGGSPKGCDELEPMYGCD